MRKCGQIQTISIREGETDRAVLTLIKLTRHSLCSHDTSGLR